MNSENFHEYVKNPSMLHQVSYQELKSLVLQYPYSPNLRYLLLLKSLFDKNKDLDKNQVMASLSSPDRKKLRALFKQYSRLREMQENYALNEEFLELKDLSMLDHVEEVEVPQANANPNQQEVPLPQAKNEAAPDDSEEEIEGGSDLSFLNNILGSDLGIYEEERDAMEPTEPTPSSLAQEILDMDEPYTQVHIEAKEVAIVPETTEGLVEEPTSIPVEAPISPSIPLEITNETAAAPASKPKSSFNTWLKQLNPPQAGMFKADLREISLNSKHLHQEDLGKEEAAQQIADHSVEEDAEIVTETLALLLEKQKLYAKAIAMYQRLSLQYPEKSSLFAAKIEELNKKL